MEENEGAIGREPQEKQGEKIAFDPVGLGSIFHSPDFLTVTSIENQLAWADLIGLVF